MKKIAPLFALALFVAGTLTQAGDFPKGSPAFETDFAKTVSIAKENGKPIIAVFSAVWCGPCQMMKKEVYPSKAVKPFHDKFNWVYIDVDEPANEKVQTKFKVEVYPTLIFLNSNGKKVDELIGGVEPGEFAEQLKGVLKKVPPPVETADKEPAEKKVVSPAEQVAKREAARAKDKAKE